MLLLQQILRLAAPDSCIVCGAEGALACRACLPALAQTKEPTCWRCNKISLDGRTCRSCRPSSHLGGVSMGAHYEGLVKDLIWGLKYQHRRDAAKILSGLLTSLLPDDKRFDLVTYVPASTNHFRQRGYDQARLIAVQVGKDLRLPVVKLLGRLGAHAQVGYSRRQRIVQAQNSFYASRPRLLKGKNILLIDDVLTTGATLNECAKVLKSKGAGRVWAGVVARG